MNTVTEKESRELMYTSPGLSEILKEKGFEGEPRMYWFKRYNSTNGKEYWTLEHLYVAKMDSNCYKVPAYVILNDLFVKYSQQMFGKLGPYFELRHDTLWKVVESIRMGEKEKGEKYLIKHTVL